MRILSTVIGATLGLVLAVSSADAVTSNSLVSATATEPQPLVQVQLVSDRVTVRPGETFWVAMHQKITPHWHTYWRNPGDSGAPTTLDWTLPNGVIASEIAWPLPDRLPVPPLMNFGYSDEVLLPVQMTAPEAASDGDVLTLTADAEWLVCEEICIPEYATISIDVVVADESFEDPDWVNRIHAVIDDLPVVSPWTSQFALGQDFQLFVDAPELKVAMVSGAVAEVAFFPYDDGLIENAETQIVTSGPAGLSLKVSAGQFVTDTDLAEGVLVFTEANDGALKRRGFLVSARKVSPDENLALSDYGVGVRDPSSGFASINPLQALIFALIGGLLLNIMPCVFPVLFMKAFGFLKQAGQAPEAIRNQGLAYTFGVMVSFAVLAGILIAMRAGGAQIGWGFQLQSPIIIAVLAYLLFGVGLMLSGLFTIGGSFMGMGQDLAQKEGFSGSFFTGVLATLVATPCTAPFMGVAMGFALTQSAVLSMAVFLTLGFGMALPFLVLSFFPQAASILPKPGPWMDRAKQALAFPMYATTAWLVWVFAQQTGGSYIFSILIGFVVLAFAAWTLGLAQDATGRGSLVGNLVGTVALTGFVLILATLNVSQTDHNIRQASVQGTTSSGLNYATWSEAAVQTALSNGQSVFVNFTAAWCITCLANERVAFSDKRVKALFEDEKIVYLKADWTNRNSVIAETLAGFGRAGVPLYLYYDAELGAGAPPQILPQVLSPGILRNTFSKEEETS